MSKNPEEVDLEPLIPIFHGWIQGQVFDELLLDVADYRHVPAGPGVVLIGLQATTAWTIPTTVSACATTARLRSTGAIRIACKQAARAALTACQRLEQEPRLGGKLRFNGQESKFSSTTGSLAPNHDATRAAAESDFQAFAKKLF